MVANMVQAKSAAAAAVKASETLIKTLEAELALREEGDAGNIPDSNPKKKEQYYVSSSQHDNPYSFSRRITVSKT
jgi:hypothetical protein